MRDLVAILAFVSLCGCSLFLDESPSPAQDARPADAAVPDAAPCQVTLAPATLVDDTIIGGGAPDFNFSAFQNMTIGDELPSVGLLRFTLPTIPAGATVVQVVLTLPHALESDQCNASCGSCDGVARAGDLEVFIGRNDWVDADVTWNSRGPGPWEEVGARGSNMDRLARLGAAPYEVDQELVAVFDVSDVEASFGQELTLILDATQSDPDPDTWTKLVVSTRENDCNGKSAAELSLGYCVEDKN